jgi:hypothetical protein
MPVRICWQTLSPSDQDYTVLVHLVGPENQVVTSRHTYPGLGSFPTSKWLTDYRFCDQITVEIPEDLQKTLVYQLEVGLLDAQDGERLQAYNQDGSQLSHTFVRGLRLEALQEPVPDVALDAEDPIQLVSAEQPQNWRGGEDHLITMTWRVNEKLTQDYTVFIHLRDLQTGENVAQADGPPLNGWYPTSAWEIGEFVDDEHVFSLPEMISPARYKLVTGWYDPQTSQRLGEEIILDTVEVLP